MNSNSVDTQEENVDGGRNSLDGNDVIIEEKERSEKDGKGGNNVSNSS